MTNLTQALESLSKSTAAKPRILVRYLGGYAIKRLVETEDNATTFPIVKVSYIAQVFTSYGTRHYYMAKVSGHPYKGSPWVLCYRDDNKPEGVLTIDECWFNNRHTTYRAFRDGRHDIFSYAFNPNIKTTSVAY